MAIGAIINSDMVPLHIRGSYQSILNLAFGIGSSLGVAMGSFLVDTLGWRWEFSIQGMANHIESLLRVSSLITCSTSPSNHTSLRYCVAYYTS